MRRNAEKTGLELLRAGFNGKTSWEGDLPGILLNVHGFDLLVGFHKKAIYVSTRWEGEYATVMRAVSPRRLAERLLQGVKDFEVRVRLGNRRGFLDQPDEEVAP